MFVVVNLMGDAWNMLFRGVLRKGVAYWGKCGDGCQSLIDDDDYDEKRLSPALLPFVFKTQINHNLPDNQTITYNPRVDSTQRSVGGY